MRIQLETQAGGVYLGMAKGWLRQLQASRKDLKLPLMDKLVRVGGFLILVRAAEWGDLIWIRGGGIGHILLTNNASSSEYNWNSDSLIGIAAPATDTIADIVPIYNLRCQIQEYSSYRFNDRWTTEEIGAAAFEFLGGMNAFEMGMFADESSVYGRIGDAFGRIAELKDISMLEYASNFGPLFGLPARKDEVSPWNLFNGVYLRALNPTTQKVLPAWFWTPGFFTALNDDPALFPGWYYGYYSPQGPIRQYANDTIGAGGFLFPQPLESLKVSFRGLLDTRYQSEIGLYQYGWAELVTQVDGDDKNDVFIYLQKDPLEIPPNSSFGFVFRTSNPEDETFWAGSAIKGFPLAFRVELDPEIVKDNISVDLWNFNSWTDPDSVDAQQDTGIGVVVAYGESAKIYRYVGAGALIFETENYHSHSYSRDGSVLAVFDGADGIITAVNVFDLFGTRNTEEQQHESGYVAGGFTLIREEGVLDSVAATSGCVIPFRAKDFEEETDLRTLPYDLATAQPDTTPEFDFTDFLPSLSTMEINKLGTRSPIFHNVICKNGVDAEFGISEDPCFESVVFQESPNFPIRADKLIGHWKYEGSHQGVVRGSYSGSFPDVRFSGDSDHNGTELLFTSTLRDLIIEFSALRQEWQCRLNLGPCVIEGLDEEGDPIFDCAGKALLTASTPCQTAEKELDGGEDLEIFHDGIPLVLNPGPPPSFCFQIPDGFPIIGSFFEARGGVPPYEFGGGSLQGGWQLDAETGEVIPLGSSEFRCETPTPGDASVTDSCGTKSTFKICGDDGVPPEVAISPHSNIFEPPPIVAVDDVFTLAFGIGPYAITFAEGTYVTVSESTDPATGTLTKVIRITELFDCSAAGTATGSLSVTDDCGKSDTTLMRFAGGHWAQVALERQGTCVEVSSISYSPTLYFGNFRSSVAYGFHTISGGDCADCEWVPSFPITQGGYCKFRWVDLPCEDALGDFELCDTIGTPLKRYTIHNAELQEWVC